MKMTGKWKTGSQRINGPRVFRVYRLKDANAADRPSNREYYDDILYADKWSLQAIVNKLNAEEERQVRK